MQEEHRFRSIRCRKVSKTVGILSSLSADFRECLQLFYEVCACNTCGWIGGRLSPKIEHCDGCGAYFVPGLRQERIVRGSFGDKVGFYLHGGHRMAFTQGASGPDQDVFRKCIGTY